MSLIDELKEKREKLLADIEEAQDEINRKLPKIADLDKAIAALTPSEGLLDPVQQASDESSSQTSGDVAAAIPEGFTAWSGKDVYTPTEDTEDFRHRVEVIFRGGLQETGEAWTFIWGWLDNAEPESNIIAYRIISEPAEASEPAEIISTLTGDPAIEPESGLHGEPSVIDAEPEAQILREHVPLDTPVIEDATGEQFAIIQGEPVQIVSEPEPAPEQPEPAKDEPLYRGDAPFWAKVLVREPV